MAPVLKRFMIASTGSTSVERDRRGPDLKSSRPRSVQSVLRLVVDQAARTP